MDRLVSQGCNILTYPTWGNYSMVWGKVRGYQHYDHYGASSWLSALPISEHGFALHRGAFRDTLCLCYGWQPVHLPSCSVCGQHFTIEHALSCPKGRFPTIQHNEIRNITADLLSGVCHCVGIEPSLQPATGEQFQHKITNREDGARLNIVAQSFWGRDRLSAFFDVRVQPIRTLLSKLHPNPVLSELEVLLEHMYTPCSSACGLDIMGTSQNQ